MRNKLEWEKKIIVQSFLSCVTSILHARPSRAIARRVSLFLPSREPPLSRQRIFAIIAETSIFPGDHTRTPFLSYVHYRTRSTSGNRLRRIAVRAWCRCARIFSAIEKRKMGKRMKVSRHAKTNRRQHVRHEERRVLRETAAGSYRTAATTAMPPRRRLKRRRRGREPRLRPPTNGNPPADRSPPPSLSVTYTTPVSPVWYVDVHPTDDVSGVREQLSLLRVNRGDDDCSSRREINGESTMDGSKFYIEDHFLSTLTPSNFGKEKKIF